MAELLISDKTRRYLQSMAESGRHLTVLTGAGISAESGIPTFRGKDGFWTVGSREYHPQEMATLQMFQKHPGAVWQWYLYRMGMCRSAEPNNGHRAVAAMESRLGDRFALVTQNVDNLHLRAGNSPRRTFEIHGNVFYTRCAYSCTDRLFPLPGEVRPKAREEAIPPEEMVHLSCPACGGWTRPHVLWFDEAYNEHYFRFESTLRLAMSTDLLMVVGTSGATNLPNQVVQIAHRRGVPILDINV